MKLLIAKHSGFCFGVSRAIELVNAAAEEGARVFTYGKIIHNETVTDELEARGIHAVESTDSLEAGDTLVIRAHGAPPEVFAACEKKGVRVIDATCPFVKRIHRIVERAAGQGERVAIPRQAHAPGGDRHQKPRGRRRRDPDEPGGRGTAHPVRSADVRFTDDRKGGNVRCGAGSAAYTRNRTACALHDLRYHAPTAGGGGTACAALYADFRSRLRIQREYLRTAGFVSKIMQKVRNH
jgi:Penicillin tolerance protein